MQEVFENSEDKFDNNLKFTSFLIAFCDSASRARKIINVLIVTSIASFLGLLNSIGHKNNWFPSRQERIRELYHLAKFEDDTINIITYLKDTTYKNTVTKIDSLGKKYTTGPNDFEFSEFIRIFNSNISFPSDSLPKLISEPPPWVHFKFPDFTFNNRNLNSVKSDTINSNNIHDHIEYIKKAKNMLCQSSYATREELNRNIEAMNRAKLENSTFVKIAILGMAFDVNWLIIVSGLGFIAIYFLLYYCFSRERKNIVLLFKIGDHEKVSSVRLYQFMSMQQVFTIPQSINEALDENPKNDTKKEGWTNDFKRLIPKILWCSPFAIWLLILIHDFLTEDIGKVLNESLTNLQFTSSLIIGGIIFSLVFLCVSESRKIDKEWKNKSEEIKKQKKEEQERKIREKFMK